MMKEFKNGTYTGERSLFATKDAYFDKCLFKDGESPLKESGGLTLNHCTFRWKYPLWYCTDVLVENSIIEETARSGIWYTKNITMNNCEISSPKTFRRAENVTLNGCDIIHAQETFWNCQKIKLNQVTAKGDYFGMNSSDIDITNLTLDGNYCFDGAKNIVIRNSTLHSKDSFWNSENVTVINSTIVGEYLAWNSKNLTFINCTIESHQGLCYIQGLKLINCKLVNTDLCFEYCSDINAEIVSHVESIKNPYSGKIVVDSVGELIMDEQYINPKKTKIGVKGK